MSIFFTFIYRVLKRNKILFFILLLISIGFCSYFAPQIKFEEDITRMMPNDAKIDRINKLLKNSKFLDRLVFTVSAADSTKELAPEELASLADSLT